MQFFDLFYKNKKLKKESVDLLRYGINFLRNVDLFALLFIILYPRYVFYNLTT